MFFLQSAMESCLWKREKLKDVFGVFKQDRIDHTKLFEEFLVNSKYKIQECEFLCKSFFGNLFEAFVFYIRTKQNIITKNNNITFSQWIKLIKFTILIPIEVVVQSCSVKKVFLKISQNSRENTSARVYFLIKLQAWGLQLYRKRDSDTGVFLWILRNF